MAEVSHHVSHPLITKNFFIGDLIGHRDDYPLANEAMRHLQEWYYAMPDSTKPPCGNDSLLRNQQTTGRQASSYFLFEIGSRQTCRTPLRLLSPFIAPPAELIRPLYASRSICKRRPVGRRGGTAATTIAVSLPSSTIRETTIANRSPARTDGPVRRSEFW